jgi:uncharacterized protein YrrD
MPREVVVDRGDDVVSMDGRKVGTVDGVAFDAVTGRPISLFVRHGFLFGYTVEVSGQYVKSVGDGHVMIGLSSDEFDRLEPVRTDHAA